MCSLAKDDFLAKAPAFMGDILWAHLEILQRDVDHGANIENVPSNYSDLSSSFAIPDTFQRTYTQLDVAPSAQLVSSSSVDASLVARPQYTQRAQSVTTNPVAAVYADYAVSNHDNGSTVDSSSEFSYQMEMKYSPQQINNGRVPAYPPHHPGIYNDQFENMWSYQNVATPLHAQQEGAWHQPHDFAPQSVTPPATTMAPPTSQTQTVPMHHHPAFLQVENYFIFYDVIREDA